MITITDKSRAALRALTELARRGGGAPVPIVEISESRGIPTHLLEQLFVALRRAGILQSHRGVKGGYSFLRSPREVTVLAVVEAVDGSLGWSAATEAARDACQELWSEACGRLVAALGEVTVADMVDREARLSGALMFHI